MELKTAREWLLEQLKGFENHEDYKEDNINAIADFMEHYAKYYHQQQVNSVDLADVGGALREIADKYEMDALERYEAGEHALSHLHMAAQARYGFEDGWKAAAKQ